MAASAAGIALLATALSGCVTTKKASQAVDTVSIRYDPYDYDMAKIRQDAETECQAKGGRYASQTSNTPNLESPRWAYMSFICYN